MSFWIFIGISKKLLKPLVFNLVSEISILAHCILLFYCCKATAGAIIGQLLAFYCVVTGFVTTC